MRASAEGAGKGERCEGRRWEGDRLEATSFLAAYMAFYDWCCYRANRLRFVYNGGDWRTSADVSGNPVHLLQVSQCARTAPRIAPRMGPISSEGFSNSLSVKRRFFLSVRCTVLKETVWFRKMETHGTADIPAMIEYVFLNRSSCLGKSIYIIKNAVGSVRNDIYSME